VERGRKRFFIWKINGGFEINAGDSFILVKGSYCDKIIRV
jgi:hypothetical protein